MTNAWSHMRAYPILFCCMVTGAVGIRVAAGYSTDKFLLQYRGHCAGHGVPTTVYTDRGSQIVKAAELDQVKLDGKIGWGMIKTTSAQEGTSWKFAPAGYQFCDRLTESRVKAAKSTLAHLREGSGLDYSQLHVLMERVANMINERPVGVMVHNKSEGPMLPLTPNMLTLGKSANTGPAAEEEYVDIKDKYAKLIKSVRRIEDEWWRQW